MIKFLYPTICYEYTIDDGYTGDSDLFYADTVVESLSKIGKDYLFIHNSKTYLASENIVDVTDEPVRTPSSIFSIIQKKIQEKMFRVKNYQEIAKEVYGVNLKDNEHPQVNPRMFNGKFEDDNKNCTI